MHKRFKERKIDAFMEILKKEADPGEILPAGISLSWVKTEKNVRENMGY